MPRECAIDHCDNLLGDRARDSTTLCPNCRSSLGYWNAMPITRVILRREKLKLYSTRVTRIIDTKRKSR